jgi:hypothetical protein
MLMTVEARPDLPVAAGKASTIPVYPRLQQRHAREAHTPHGLHAIRMLGTSHQQMQQLSKLLKP